METEISRGMSSAIDRHPLITTPDTLILEAIGLMSQVRYGCILVVAVREGIQFPLGILTDQDVVQLIAAQTDLSDLAIAGVMDRQLITINQEQAEDIMVLTHLLQKYQNCYFPVISDRGSLIGLVTPQSIRNLLKPVDLFRLKQVQEAISELVIHTSIDTSLQEVIQLMSQQRGNYVVITNPPLIPVGIITEWDILQFFRRGLDLDKTTAGVVMSRPLMLVQLDDSMWTAHQIMQRLGVRRLVVSNAQGELAGVITHTNILMDMDPLEIHQTVSTLKHLVNEQTTRLTEINNQLNIEINELKLLEQKIVSSEQQLRAIMEVITDIILTVNLKNDQLGSIDIVPIKEKLEDEHRLAIINETIRNFFYGDVDWLRRVRQVLTTTTSEQFDYTLEIDGQNFWFTANISPVSEDSVVWVARDISKQQAALSKCRLAEIALSQLHQIHLDLAQTLGEMQRTRKSTEISAYDYTQEQKLLNLINHGLYFSQNFSGEHT